MIAWQLSADQGTVLKLLKVDLGGVLGVLAVCAINQERLVSSLKFTRKKHKHKHKQTTFDIAHHMKQ